MNLRNVFWQLASPSQLLLLAPLVGAMFVAAGFRRTGRVIIGLAMAALVAFGLLPGSAFVARPLETRFPQPVLPDSISGMVLLTGAESTAASAVSGLPQLGSHANRYVAVLRLATRYPAARIVVSGEPLVRPGQPELDSQTAVANAILRDLGVDPKRVTFEQRSWDTCDNARNTRSLVDPRPGETWVLVTSAMHMPRAVACFRAVGWGDVVPLPDAYQAVPGFDRPRAFRIVDNLQLLDEALHEWVGLAYYRVTGRTEELFPAPAAPEIDPGGSDP